MKRSAFVLLFVLFAAQCHKSPRGVILVIADGMGPQQLSLLHAWHRQAGTHSAHEILSQKSHMALVTTFTGTQIVTDSAAAATQLSSGELSQSEMIGMNMKGEKVTSIAEFARDRGYKVGLVSDTRLTHATPSAFYAHRVSRLSEEEIATDAIASRFDVLISGGSGYFLPASAGYKKFSAGLRRDNLNLLELAEKNKYRLVSELAELRALPAGGKVLALFGKSAMPDGFEEERYRSDPAHPIPTLAEAAVQALRLLQADSSPFFLMVEAGQIDWACHSNDAGLLLREMRRFDRLVAELDAFAGTQPDVLLVVTSDHETGGFGFSYGKAHLPRPEKLATGEEYFPRFWYPESQMVKLLERQKRSFYALAGDIAARDAAGHPFQIAQWRATFSAATGYTLTEKQAAAMLRRVPNRRRIPGHPALDFVSSPEITDFADFYTYANQIYTGLMARDTASQSGIVWASAGHTATPVVLLATGPGETVFHGTMHNTEVGKILKRQMK